MKAIITVMGKDRTGIIAMVSNVLLNVNVNILDISQTTMQGLFTMIMMVDISECKVDFAELSNTLAKEGEKIGTQIVIQHEDIFNNMHKVQRANMIKMFGKSYVLFILLVISGAIASLHFISDANGDPTWLSLVVFLIWIFIVQTFVLFYANK